MYTQLHDYYNYITVKKKALFHLSLSLSCTQNLDTACATDLYHKCEQLFHFSLFFPLACFLSLGIQQSTFKNCTTVSPLTLYFGYMISIE